MKRSILRLIVLGLLVLAAGTTPAPHGWGGPPPLCDPDVQVCPA